MSADDLSPEEREQLRAGLKALLTAAEEFLERTTGERPSREDMLAWPWQRWQEVSDLMAAEAAALEALAVLGDQSLDDLEAAGFREGETFGEFVARGGVIPGSVVAFLHGAAATD